MKFRSQSIAQSMSSLWFGLLLLVAPGIPLWLLGLEATLGAEILGRLCGGMLIALGNTIWASSDSTDPVRNRRIAYGNAAVDAAMAVVFGAYTIAGSLGPIGYLFAVVFVINCVTWLLAIRSTPEG